MMHAKGVLSGLGLESSIFSRKQDCMKETCQSWEECMDVRHSKFET